MRTVYSYIRFSTKDQLQGDSLRRQTDSATEWITKKGYALDSSLKMHDLGFSGFANPLGQDGALAGFLVAIKKGKVKKGSVLLVEKMDRLTRNEVIEALPPFLAIINAGVAVCTINDDMEYSHETIKNNQFAILPLIIQIIQNNLESAKKSDHAVANWTQKRATIKDKPITALCPAWLTPVLDSSKSRGKVSGFTINQERAKVVQTIFDLTIAGKGLQAIVRELNGQNVPVFSKRKNSAVAWHQSYIHKILYARSVFGEFQPCVKRTREKRTPVGDVIPDYYPAIVSKATFYQAHASIGTRKVRTREKAKEQQEKKPSRNAKHRNKKKGTKRNNGLTTNLFTGKIVDSKLEPYCIVDKQSSSRGKLLVARSNLRKTAKGYSPTFPYKYVEQAILQTLKELKPSDLVTAPATDLDVIDGEILNLKAKIQTITARIKTTGNIDALLDALTNLDAEVKAKQQAKEELLKSSMSTGIEETQSLISFLSSCPPETVNDVRLRLKTELAQLIDTILLTIQGNPHATRKAVLRIGLKSGVFRIVIVELPPMGEPTIISKDYNAKIDKDKLKALTGKE
jgi:DNA invertase Pin-like site-specific DNA recombinase